MNPTSKDYWRALILYGKQQSTYKIALGNCLLKYSAENNDRVSLDDLTQDFFDLYAERLKAGKPQQGIMGRKTVVEREIDAINLADKSVEKSLETIKKVSLNDMVLQRFNVLYNRQIPEPFYTTSDDSEYLILNNNLLSIFSDSEYDMLTSELSSRWDLLEHAFEMMNNIEALDVDEYSNHIIKKEKRTNLTKLIPVLNGYQMGKCFYCGEDLYDIAVDHLIPYQAIMHNKIWNLVLAHRFCNEQKSDNLPPLSYVEDLIIRNEYFIESAHPLKNTLINELGVTKKERIKKIQNEYQYAKNKIGRVWSGYKGYDPKDDSYYRNWVKILGKKTL
ncbi:MAG: hypothetical protein QG646_4282 [Euryarchaeota archaeon]|nr:hypothetical protein [Euryarchaeota archaeon]